MRASLRSKGIVLKMAKRRIMFKALDQTAKPGLAQLRPQTPPPDLVIYLQAPAETLAERVQQRGMGRWCFLRLFEQGFVARHVEVAGAGYQTSSHSPRALRVVHLEDGDGDARRALNILDLAVGVAQAEEPQARTVRDDVLEQVLTGGWRRFDRGGDEFYEREVRRCRMVDNWDLVKTVDARGVGGDHARRRGVVLADLVAHAVDDGRLLLRVRSRRRRGGVRHAEAPQGDRGVARALLPLDAGREVRCARHASRWRRPLLPGLRG